MRLVVRGVGKSFGATRALADVSLEAAAGEVHAVLGENGAGKSTLMRVLAGVEAADEGTITLDGAPFRPRGPAEARRAGVSLVSQELSLCPHLTVSENVVLGEEATRWGLLDRARIAREVSAVLAEVSGGRIDPSVRAGDLPLAEQQLVEIARALVHRGGGDDGAARCRVLILDEPTSSLGREDAARLFALIRRLKSEQLTVLYISHFLEEVAEVADRYTVLRDGTSVATGALAGTTISALVEQMAGRPVELLFRRSARTAGDVVLAVTDLAGRTRPSRASLELRRGEVLGVAGLVGAGRTELLRAVFGLDEVVRGSVRVKAWTGRATPRRRLAQGVGLLSEDRQGEGLALSLSIADNVTLSRMGGLGPLAQTALRALDDALGLVAPARARDAAARWVAELSVKCRSPAQRVDELSGGNQQKVALARLLHHDVDVLLLDEPTRGIDVGSKAQIYALIDRVAAAGKAVLVVSSYLPELLGVCDRIAVMCRGELGEARPTEAWTERTLLEHALGAAVA